MVKPETLQGQVLFEDIDASLLENLSKVVTEISLKKGEALYRENDDTKGIYMIQSGKVEISKVTADGWQQTLAVFPPRHFFGELSIMEKRRHEANATALEDSKLLFLSKEDFEKLENEQLGLAFQVIKKIAFVQSKNLRHMNERFLKALINY